MHAKQKFLIMLIVLVVLLVIGMIIIFYFYSENQKPAQANQNISKKTNSQVININQEAEVNTNESAVVNTNQETPANMGEEEEKNYVLKLARNFTERFGTYSNQNESSNLLGLKDYMTKDMKNWADDIIAKNKNKPNEVYYSVVAKVTTIDLQEFDSSQNRAKVAVGTIKQETKGWPVSESEYQENLEIELKKIDGTWKVNSAYWHKN